MKIDSRAKKCYWHEVPPYYYLQPGRTAEEAAVIAVRAMGIHNAIDALILFWKLRQNLAQVNTNLNARDESKPSKRNRDYDSQ